MVKNSPLGTPTRPSPRDPVWIQRLTPVWQQALELKGALPERNATQLAAALAEYDVLEFAIDGTERRRQRPQDKAAPKKYYSGKKKMHTIKNLESLLLKSLFVLALKRCVD